MWYEHRDSGIRDPYTPCSITPDEGDRRHSNGFLELRLTPQEAQDLAALMRLCHAENASAAVRAALRFLEDVSRHLAGGKGLVAVSRSGESFPILAAGDGSSDEWRGPRAAQRTGEMPSEREPAGDGSPADTGFSSLLPSSLWGEIEELAAQEQCSPHLLVVDLVRQGVAGRRRDFAAGLHDVFARESEQAQPAGDSASERRHAAAPPGTAETTCNGIPATLAPPSVQEGWALVVAQDYDGTPTGQLVTPDTVIPLDTDELGTDGE